METGKDNIDPDKWIGFSKGDFRQTDRARVWRESSRKSSVAGLVPGESRVLPMGCGEAAS